MSRQDVIRQLAAARPIIAPSMLKCDFGNLAGEIAQLETAGAQILHWDVMDGHFVPNLSYGALVIERLRPRTGLIFDAHLMMSQPARYLDDFLRAGCDVVTVHAEAVDEPASVLQRIRERGAVAGLAINPGTPLSAVEGVLRECDLLLVMSVEPGFGGQKFIPASLEKLREARQLLPESSILAVDGGIGLETIGPAAAAGAGFFVVGSAVFESDDYGRSLRDLGQRAGGSV
ncbi:MAG: ribulose-phosphate 3-epimerase [Planctomycetes bacterium]|nr:ribulose-phosphate 3-epimerase [Planctomycetota bacterium]